MTKTAMKLPIYTKFDCCYLITGIIYHPHTLHHQQVRKLSFKFSREYKMENSFSVADRVSSCNIRIFA